MLFCLLSDTTLVPAIVVQDLHGEEKHMPLETRTSTEVLNTDHATHAPSATQNGKIKWKGHIQKKAVVMGITIMILILLFYRKQSRNDVVYYYFCCP